MNEFCYVQTGKFYTGRNISADPFNDKYFFKNIELIGIFCREYSKKTLSYSKARILNRLEHYTAIKTGINISATEELILYCDEERAETIINMIKEYLSNPYEITGKVKLTLSSDMFWWCLDFRSDVPSFGDWMACSSKNVSVLRKNLLNYYVKWIEMPEQNRKSQLFLATMW